MKAGPRVRAGPRTGSFWSWPVIRGWILAGSGWGGVGGCGGARGDVRGGAARERSRRRQCLPDSRGGRSLSLVCSFSACCFGAAVPASELVLGSRSRCCLLLVASADWLLVLSLHLWSPPVPRGAFRWASSLPLPPAPHRSSRDEFFHLFRDEPGDMLWSYRRRRRERARLASERRGWRRRTGGQWEARSDVQVSGWDAPSLRCRHSLEEKPAARADFRSWCCHGCQVALATQGERRPLLRAARALG